MKKLLLINPVKRRSGYLLSPFSTFPPLGLSFVAAVTPSNWEVKIADENFEEWTFEAADLVGITAFTSSITRAYEIAQTYRRQGITVIMGGIHASMCPDEVLQYADAVVIGEVEGIWQTVIKDFEHNRLQAQYVGPHVDFSQPQVKPRRDLLNPGYVWNSVQTSRGCPFNCDFCSVSRYLGKAYRQRFADDVLAELAGIDGELIAFLDDNLVGVSAESKERAKELFTGMIRSGISKKWWMQTSINSADDEHLLALAAEAGCLCAFIGFEAISEKTLKGMHKGINLKLGIDNYKNVVKAFHKYGIAVYGAFILGNDFESAAYYRQLADFIARSGIDIVQISLLTPLPGTRLMEQMQKEKRIIYQNFPQDWEKYRLSYLVHRPNGIDPATIYIGNNHIKQRLYSFPTYQMRIFRSFMSLRNVNSFYATKKFNASLKKAWQGSHYYRDYPAEFPESTTD
ncbi:MAG: radical SAM protein [Desulfobacterales bacterium]|nr:radical SAM protein [Desulfobacterales bacterium]